MDTGVVRLAPRNSPGGETAAHARLKRLALLWAQAQGYSACAMEVSLPRCRYRADVAAYRSQPNEIGTTAIFEGKQALVDLRRDNGSRAETRAPLWEVFYRRQVLEKKLPVRYPKRPIASSLVSQFSYHGSRS